MALRTFLAVAASLALATPVAAEWKPTERVETYAIRGTTGAELYGSIGERGPKVGVGRAIAHTDFQLTWRRDYQPRDGGCVLASAVPRLVITYTLPKAPAGLAADVDASWKTFIAGVEAHERVHGDYIEELARQIEAVTVGLSVADDPGCRKIRKELTNRLAPLAAAHRERNSSYDRAELSQGGNVHQLILNLVNGP